jgi:hypothetical protein
VTVENVNRLIGSGSASSRAARAERERVEEEEQRKLRQERLNRDFGAMIKVIQGQSEFPSQDVFMLNAINLCSSIKWILLRLNLAATRGSENPILSEEDSSKLIRYTALREISGTKDPDSLLKWLEEARAYKAREQYFRVILKDSGSTFSPWARYF